MFDSFTKLGYDTYLINCQCPNDPPFKQTDKVISLPNVYYSGQWNEALKLFTGDVAFILNSDVKIKDYKKVMNRLVDFYDKFGERAGLYSPNHYWTPWTYDPELLSDLGDGLKCVPATDSTLWSVCREIALKVGPMDLNVNKLGWGIEILAAWYCSMVDKLVVRDYGIKCQHPQNTSYDRYAADTEWRDMIDKMGVGDEFWQYYDTRERYGFGWTGDDTKYLQRKKLLL